mmetsp:Transcript_22626/g.57943  ORF Transcript_22626/g.57943 Transcript_22626/m.57943 type:complete len:116 (+) Transcript_22626:230-577(+)|eukprot:jgi/Tetstr1/427359/TSEL_001739.t1
MGAQASRAHATNDYELVIRSSKELEALLETEFGASGRGLHEKITSVQGQLSPGLVKQMRYLATIRNKLIHEPGFDDIPDRAAFIRRFEESLAELQAILRARGSKAASSLPSCVIA